MKVLVVGGAGYIGGALTDLLGAQKDYSVRVYDALLYEEAFRKKVDFAFGDIRNPERLLPHLKWADVVVWLAALVGDGACALDPEVSVEVNQLSVRWLSEHFEGRIVYLSTCSVYGAQEGVLDENSPTNPLSIYAATKLASEDFLKNKNAIIFRLGTVFGVGDLFSRVRLDLVVNILTVRAATKGEITVFGGEQFRPLLHVKDVGHAILENLHTSPTGIYALHRQDVRIIDLAYQVRSHFPDVVINQTEIKFQDARNYRVSSAKARRDLAFAPRYSIDDGIEEVKELVQNGRLKDLNSPRYANHSFLEKYQSHLLSLAP